MERNEVQRITITGRRELYFLLKRHWLSVVLFSIPPYLIIKTICPDLLLVVCVGEQKKYDYYKVTCNQTLSIYLPAFEKCSNYTQLNSYVR